MAVVAGKVQVNQPFFFTSKSGTRVEFPAFGIGQGDLEGAELERFKMYVAAEQIAMADPAPVNSVAPVISGTAEVGEELTADDGTWSGSPTFTYQWRRSSNGTTGWANISGATDVPYTQVAADEDKYLLLRVTGTNGTGSATADSNVIGPVAAAA